MTDFLLGIVLIAKITELAKNVSAKRFRMVWNKERKDTACLVIAATDASLTLLILPLKS